MAKSIKTIQPSHLRPLKRARASAPRALDQERWKARGKSKNALAGDGAKKRKAAHKPSRGPSQSPSSGRPSPARSPSSERPSPSPALTPAVAAKPNEDRSGFGVIDLTGGGPSAPEPRSVSPNGSARKPAAIPRARILEGSPQAILTNLRDELNTCQREFRNESELRKKTFARLQDENEALRKTLERTKKELDASRARTNDRDAAHEAEKLEIGRNFRSRLDRVEEKHEAELAHLKSNHLADAERSQDRHLRGLAERDLKHRKDKAAQEGIFTKKIDSVKKQAAEEVAQLRDAHQKDIEKQTKNHQVAISDLEKKCKNAALERQRQHESAINRVRKELSAIDLVEREDLIQRETAKFREEKEKAIAKAEAFRKSEKEAIAKVAELRRSLDEKETAHRNKVETIQREVGALESKNLQLRKTLDQTQLRVEEIEKEAEATEKLLQEKLKSTETEASQVRKNLELDFKEKLEKAAKEVEEGRNASAILNSKLKSAESKVAELEEKVKQLQLIADDHASYMEKAEMLQSEFDKVTSKTSQLQSELEEVESNHQMELSFLKASGAGHGPDSVTIEHLEEQIRTLKTDLERNRHEKDVAYRQLSQVCAAAQGSGRQNATLCDQIQAKETQIVNAQKLYEEKQKECTRQRASIASLGRRVTMLSRLLRILRGQVSTHTFEVAKHQVIMNYQMSSGA